MKRFKNLKILASAVIIASAGICCRKDQSAVKEAIIKSKPQVQAIDKNCDADFDIFFEKFSSDSVFQKQHVKFPLHNTYLNSEGNYEKKLRYIKPEEYLFSDFKRDKAIVNIENGSYKVEIIKEKDSAFYQVRGIDNGIFTDVKFVLIDGCWYMVAIEDSST